MTLLYLYFLTITNVIFEKNCEKSCFSYAFVTDSQTSMMIDDINALGVQLFEITTLQLHFLPESNGLSVVIQYQ